MCIRMVENHSLYFRTCFKLLQVTKKHNEDCKWLLRLMGIPVIEAPCEAEAECAALCKCDKVYAVASEDMDTLTFGAPRFLRHFMVSSSKKVPVMEFEVSKVLEELELTMDQFIDLCILSGCDYCNSIKGIGGQTALKLIRQHGRMETILENINRERYQIPDDWPYQEARQLFKEPRVSLELPELKWTTPDEKGLLNFLVTENGFNHNRVTKAIGKIKAAKNKFSQGRLESFSVPVLHASSPPKQKENRCMLGTARLLPKSRMFTLQICRTSSFNIGRLKLPMAELQFRCHEVLYVGSYFSTGSRETLVVFK